MSPEKGAQGEGEESKRAREGAEAGSRGLAACDVVFPRSLPSLSAFSLLSLLLCLLGGSKLDQPSAAFRLIRN